MSDASKGLVFDKIMEAYAEGYVKRCPSCGSFKVSACVNDDYPIDMIEYHCDECTQRWS